ncbi:MAG: cardiolipin synthase [Eubacteriales bacterium]|nr:cardiolipin synthase [Eubacteriales bacterium]
MELWNQIWQGVCQAALFIWNHILFLNLVLSIIVIFFQRKEPKSVWAWLLVLNALPGIGFLLYLLAGTDMHKRKMFKIKGIEEKVNDAVRRQEYSVRSRELEASNPELKHFSDLVYFNLESSEAMLTGDNEVRIFTDGNDKFDTLIEDLKRAESYIFLQYYIIRNDVLFSRIRDVLTERAAAGVEVRVLYDAMGCRSVNKSCWRQLEEKGIRTAVFFPALFGRLHLRVNYRNHRKIVVIDGKIGYVGGFNIGKEYIGLDPKFGHWRDTHLRIRGSAVGSLLMRYIQDWDYAARENLFAEPKYFVLPDCRPGDTKMQIISSGPDSVRQNVRDNYLLLINRAKKRIFIQTPYFIPDEAIQTALLLAALSGVEVNVMIPCKPDHPFVYWATYSYVGELVMAGANCYTYDNGFLHSKGVSIDGEACCYGTANMDIRSFSLNFEVNAMIYDERVAREMERIFEEDLKLCSQITKDMYRGRSLWHRFKEQVCRLLSPVL